MERAKQVQEQSSGCQTWDAVVKREAVRMDDDDVAHMMAQMNHGSGESRIPNPDSFR